MSGRFAARLAFGALTLLGGVALAAAPLRGAVTPLRGEGRASTSFVLRVGTLYTGDVGSGARDRSQRGVGEVLRDVSVVVRDGRIESILEPSDALPNDLRVIDRRDAVVTPGFVAAETALSDVNDERVRFTSGTIVTFRTVDPLRRAIDGFSFVDRRDALLAAGITTAYVAPGRARLVNGRGAVVKLAGPNEDARTVREVGDLALTVGAEADNPPGTFEAPLPPSAENPIRPATPQFPRTRAGAVYALRRAAEASRDFAKEWKGAANPKARPAFDPERLAFAECLEKRTPVRLRTSSEPDAMAAIDFLRENGLKGALVGGRELAHVAAALKEAAIPAVVEVALPGAAPPADPNPRIEIEKSPAETVRELIAQGVRVALVPRDPAALPNFPLVLAVAIRGGMSRADAVRAVTREPARILGIDARTGIVAPGRDADFLVLTGEPGELTTTVREAYIGGEVAFDRADADRRRAEADRAREPQRPRPLAGQGSIVVRAGLVLPVAGDPIPNGSIAIHEGRIVGVGRDVAVPRGARVVDYGPDSVATPGLLDSRSFLGLEDRNAFTGAAQLGLLALPASPEFRWVASGGVTTVLVQSPGFVPQGSPVAALKTGGHASQAVVREACGIGIPNQGSNGDGYRQLLNRGKQYSEKWDQYFVAVDKEKADAKANAAKPAEEKPAAKDEKPADEKPAAADPVTGTWEGTLTGRATPGPLVLKLRLKGDQVSGSLSGFGMGGRGGGGGRGGAAPADIEFEGGTFKDGTITLKITLPGTPLTLTVTAKIDRPDHMTGRIEMPIPGATAIEFDATRTEKSAPVIAAKPRSSKKGPEMPPIDDTLEPFRRLFHGDATILVACDAKEDIEVAIAVVVDEFKLPLAILGGSGAADLAPTLAAKRVGILFAPSIPQAPSGLPVATHLSMARAPFAIGSSSGTGGHDLPDVGAFAVARGVGGDAVLRAMTLDAATMFRIDGRVGSLEAGKDGDVVIWTGTPFSAAARVKAVVVGGIAVDEPREQQR